ncbi:MAG TPA: S1C family serine protease [bacterium]|nr:S1C family serine protease [bacterium]
MKKIKKDKINLVLVVVCVSFLLGLIGGGLAYIYFNSWGGSQLLDSNQEVNLNSPEYNNTSLIIQDPKKVYISQDLKIEESLNYFSEAVVGIFPKMKEIEDPYQNNYIIGEENFSGLIISNDGWVVINVLENNNFDKNILKNKDNYVVVSRKGKKIYDISEIVDFSNKGLLFIKIKDVNNLPARNFVNIADLRSGQTILAYNFSDEIIVNTINSINSGEDLKFSNNYQSYITLNNDLPESFKNGYLFNLSGDLLGLVDNDLNIRPIHDFRSNIYGFLKNKEVSDIKFGLYYLDLKNIISGQLPVSGALVYNNGLNPFMRGQIAESSGLQIGDIITKINNYEINDQANFNDVLNNFVLGDKISLIIIRNGETVELKIELK